MPVLKPGDKILVTGVNGFVAMWAVQRLLDRGYSVRGTVRSSSKGRYVKEYFHSYGDRFELAIVPDITKKRAFDESLIGVAGVLHMATPLPNTSSEDPKDFIEPALSGTLEVLKSALEVPKMKRIVVTSSVAAMIKDVSEPTTFSEKDWNEEAVKLTEEQGINATRTTKYAASKVIAEKAAWEFYEQHKQTSPYDLVVITPPWVFGPAIHESGKEPSSLGTSTSTWYNNVVGNPDIPRSDEILEEVVPWVDVRDLADAHISALEKQEASGERILVAAANTSWQQWIDAANQVHSSPLSHPLPRGKPGIPPKELLRFDVGKEARLLGMKYRDITEVAKDSLVVFAEKGW